MGHKLEGTLASDASAAATLRAPARQPSGARQPSLSGGSPEAARAASSVPGASLAPVAGRPSLLRSAAALASASYDSETPASESRLPAEPQLRAAGPAATGEEEGVDSTASRPLGDLPRGRARAAAALGAGLGLAIIGVATLAGFAIGGQL